MLPQIGQRHMEFSNIHGLGELRFPKGYIKATFHDVLLICRHQASQTHTSAIS
jgi:hypothetical protein